MANLTTTSFKSFLKCVNSIHFETQAGFYRGGNLRKIWMGVRVNMKLMSNMACNNSVSEQLPDHRWCARVSDYTKQ